MPLIWPGFSVTAASDRPAEAIEVVDYDPHWPRLFAAWRDRIVAALATAALKPGALMAHESPGAKALTPVP